MSDIESSVYTGFVVNRIKDIYFSINEDLLTNLKERQIKFEVGQTLGTNEERKLINLTIRTSIVLVDTNEIIADIKVQNIFFIKELDQYINSNKLKIPSDTIVSMVSVGIAHTRALFAKNLAGTPLERNILPVVNPLTLAQEFFPGLFNNKGLAQRKERQKRQTKTK